MNIAFSIRLRYALQECTMCKCVDEVESVCICVYVCVLAHVRVSADRISTRNGSSIFLSSFSESKVHRDEIEELESPKDIDR